MNNIDLFFQIYNLSHRFPLLDNLMIFGAEYLIYLTFFLMIFFFFFGSSKDRKAFILASFAYLIAYTIAQVIHLFYFEPRPFVTFPITPLISHTANAAFPSGHTLTMTSIAFAYTYYKSFLTPFFLIFLVWIGFARIFVGVHYPQDILGGIVVGFIAVILARLMEKVVSGFYLQKFHPR